MLCHESLKFKNLLDVRCELKKKKKNPMKAQCICDHPPNLSRVGSSFGD